MHLLCCQKSGQRIVFALSIYSCHKSRKNNRTAFCIPNYAALAFYPHIFAQCIPCPVLAVMIFLFAGKHTCNVLHINLQVVRMYMLPPNIRRILQILPFQPEIIHGCLGPAGNIRLHITYIDINIIRCRRKRFKQFIVKNITHTITCPFSIIRLYNLIFTCGLCHTGCLNNILSRFPLPAKNLTQNKKKNKINCNLLPFHVV